MNLQFVQNLTKDSAEIILHGTVGSEINGFDVSREIDFLIESGIKTIRERINSPGGSIINGYSIVAANLRAIEAGVTVETLNEGLCASMAGIISQCASDKRRFANDYSLYMFHEPSFMGDSLETTKDEKVRKALVSFRDSLVNIVMSKTGKTKSETEKIFKEETWYNAKEARDDGFADRVIKFNKSPKLNSEMPIDTILMETAAFIGETKPTFVQSIKNNKSMKKVTDYLKLNEAATEDVVLQAVEAISQKVEMLTTEKTALETEKATLTAEVITLKAQIATFEAEKKEAEKASVTAIVEKAITDGIFDAAKKGEIVNKYVDNLAGLSLIVSSIKPQHPGKINAELTVKGKDGKEEKKNYSWYAKNDTKALAAMTEAEQDALYKAEFETK